MCRQQQAISQITMGHVTGQRCRKEQALKELHSGGLHVSNIGQVLAEQTYIYTCHDKHGEQH